MSTVFIIDPAHSTASFSIKHMMTASAQTKIKRKDFGLTWNAALEAGGFLVGDDVNISIDVQFAKKV